MLGRVSFRLVDRVTGHPNTLYGCSNTNVFFFIFSWNFVVLSVLGLYGVYALWDVSNT